jgi:hypothetical protein
MSNTSAAPAHRGVRRAALERGSVPVPWFFLDALMPAVTPHEFVVLLFVWRKTVGWDKARDWISLSQMQKGTGLSRNTILRAVGLWCSVGLVMRLERHGIRGTVAYAVNVDYDEATVLNRLGAPVHAGNRSKGCTSTGSTEVPPPVQGMNTQEVTIHRKPGRESDTHLSDREKTRKNIERRRKLDQISTVREMMKSCHDSKERAKMQKWLDEQEAEMAGTCAPRAP